MDQQELDARLRVLLKSGEPDINDEKTARKIYEAVSARQCVDPVANGEWTAPLVDESTSAERLKRKSGKRPMLPARPRVRHTALVVASSLLVAAALVVGTYEAVVHMGKERAIVVITDDSLSSGNGGAAALTGAKAELLAEIQRIRGGVKSGTLILDWPAPGIAAGALPSDPLQLLDFLEKTVSAQDVTLFLVDGAGEASALQSEILAMPEVSRVVFVSKEDALARLKEDFKSNPEILDGLATNPLPACLEVWLKDSEQAAAFADRFRDRPEVAEVAEARSSQMDYAGWTTRLRSLTRSARDSETSTTWMTAPTNDAPNEASSVSSTTGATSDTGPRLKWGDVARLSDREVKIEKPVEKPEQTGTRPGSMVVYALVTITNTGTETIDYAASEFFIEGNSSGSTGIATLDGTIDGVPVLAHHGTLSPGGSVTAAVCFSLSTGDVPVKVRLGTQFSTAIVLASWQ